MLPAVFCSPSVDASITGVTLSRYTVSTSTDRNGFNTIFFVCPGARLSLNGYAYSEGLLDQDGNDDAATEHRDAQIAAEGLKRTLRHDARRGSRPRTMPIRSATPGRNSPWKRWNEFRRCQTGMVASTPNEPFRTRQILLSRYLELDRNSVRENVAFGHIPAARRTLRRATGRKRRRGKRRGRAIKRHTPTEAPLRRRGTSAAVERRQVSSA